MKRLVVMYPTHVVVDTHDGYVFSNGNDGTLLTKETATALARQYNAHMKPEHKKYALFRLVPENVEGDYTLSEDGTVYPL